MSLLFDEIRITQQLDFSCSNQDQIRNQRLRLHKKNTILGRKAAGGCETVPFISTIISTLFLIIYFNFISHS